MSFSPSVNSSKRARDVLLAAVEVELELRARQAAEMEESDVWTPQAGPQHDAYYSKADITGYGGAAGGGKSDLLLGLAGTKHYRSIIFRREFTRLNALIERSRELFNATGASHQKDSFNENLHRWRLLTGQLITFAGMKDERDKFSYQGQPHDFYGFDELTEFSESQFRFVTGWNRSTRPGQRCRIVVTFNPPMDESQDWVTRYFAPWLDSEHSDPADDGVLRYVARLDDQDTFYHTLEDIPDDVRVRLEEQAREQGLADWRAVPRTRTFYHAKLIDNPLLAGTGYGATIEGLPEPLRSLLKGLFNAGRATDPWQVIPADWVRAAQARWTPEPPNAGLARCVGCDVARGGADKTVIAEFVGAWLAPLKKYPGIATPDGPTVAGLLTEHIANESAIGIDIIGVGSSVYDTLVGLGIKVTGINFGAGTVATDKSGKIKLRNVRAEAYWKLREALDPDRGDDLALPPDPELLADLCAPKWRLTGGGIVIEEKDEIISRIGRSPDCGDAVALAHYVISHGLYGKLFY